MQIGTNCLNAEHDATQFGAIRDLMLEASTKGDWLTLAEISASTEFGEASISAQLRHLRKPRFGHYRVEKRRRDLCTNGVLSFSDAGCADTSVGLETVRQGGAPENNELQRVFGPWEYRVFAAHEIKSLETLEAHDAISELVDELTRSHNLERSLNSGRSRNLEEAHDDAVSQSGIALADEAMRPDGVSESCSALASDLASCVADAASPLAEDGAASANPYNCIPIDTGEDGARAGIGTDAQDASDASAREVCDR